MKENPFRERSYDRNVRYICYSLLSKVAYNDEPVVPRILSEKEDEWLGKYFEVECLPGIDLLEYFSDKEKPKSEKLKVLLHVVRQLKAIDKAGYVIFDRHGNNIRVLSSDPIHVSTRQIDIEDMYDKRADALYSLQNASMSDETVDLLKGKGVSLWAPSVDKLAIEGEMIGETHGDQSIIDIFSLCRWKIGEKGHNLDDLERACLHAIDQDT